MARTPSTMVPLGSAAPDFDLPDFAGERYRRADLAGKPLLVIFLCNHCPFVVHVREGLVAMARDLQQQGIAVVGINSNIHPDYPEDSVPKMAEYSKAWGMTFPYLADVTQEVAKAYGAACTPDFFLFDAQHRLVYRGQMDGARPGNDVPADGRDLRAAAAALLAGEPIPEPQLPSLGCNIKWKAGNAPRDFG